jgi:hypothetical protein
VFHSASNSSSLFASRKLWSGFWIFFKKKLCENTNLQILSEKHTHGTITSRKSCQKDSNAIFPNENFAVRKVILPKHAKMTKTHATSIFLV